MIKFEHTEVVGWEPAVRGMRNPMNSWEKSDSEFVPGAMYEDGYIDDSQVIIGPNDHDLMMRLAKAGSVDGKFRRMIVVYVDITAPLYWWKEFDTYKVGTVANSCSTMHKIHAKEFTLGDFSLDHLFIYNEDIVNQQIARLNEMRDIYLNGGSIDCLNGKSLMVEPRDKEVWWQMIQLLPTSYNQKRTVMLNYEVLSNIYKHRRFHKLDEWRVLCAWIKTLPYSEIITCNADKEDI